MDYLTIQFRGFAIPRDSLGAFSLLLQDLVELPFDIAQATLQRDQLRVRLDGHLRLLEQNLSLEERRN